MPQILSGNPVGYAVIGQAGGPTAVINQSLVGIIETLRGHAEIRGILGMRHGVAGLVRDEIIDLGHINEGQMNVIAATPSAALGSTRDKPDAEYCHRIFEACARRNIHYFFYIGGNDSSDTCRIVNDMARDAGYQLRCFHIPKTIDNDLPGSDHTPGYPSAARFVAQAFMGDNLDNIALPGIKINVVMGRHAGWLTAAAALARQYPDDGPQLICLPEVPFQQDRFLEAVESVYSQLGRCLIAVSEGIHDESGTPIAKLASQREERDPHGNLQLSGSGALGDYLAALIKQHLGNARVRADTFGYLQRSFCGCVSDVDAREARECGRVAARLALSGDLDSSLAIQRLPERHYRSTVVPVRLTDVAARTRLMEPGFIEGEFNVTDSFLQYLRPLVGKLPVIARLL